MSMNWNYFSFVFMWFFKFYFCSISFHIICKTCPGQPLRVDSWLCTSIAHEYELKILFIGFYIFNFIWISNHIFYVFIWFIINIFSKTPICLDHFIIVIFTEKKITFRKSNIEISISEQFQHNLLAWATVLYCRRDIWQWWALKGVYQCWSQQWVFW